MTRQFKACRASINNDHGEPPVEFLNELVDWADDAPAKIFLPNDRKDVYSHVNPVLGPWKGPKHRKAVMLEVLRVLAAFESDWNWKEGVDAKKKTKNTDKNEEAGIF